MTTAATRRVPTFNALVIVALPIASWSAACSRRGMSTALSLLPWVAVVGFYLLLILYPGLARFGRGPFDHPDLVLVIGAAAPALALGAYAMRSRSYKGIRPDGPFTISTGGVAWTILAFGAALVGGWVTRSLAERDRPVAAFVVGALAQGLIFFPATLVALLTSAGTT